MFHSLALLYYPVTMKKDFFISRAGADKAIALSIAGIVERAGFTKWLQDKDFGHASFMARMAEGYSSDARLIALLSSSYQQSQHCKAEYEHTLVDDPRNLKERLIVLRIEAVAPIEHLKALAFTDLIPVLNDATELERVVRIAIGADPRPADFPLYTPATIIIHPAVSAVAGFIGREVELAAIDDVLFGPKDSSTSSAALTDANASPATLRGMGGVGKSVLAKQYAWTHRDHFVGIGWLRAETAETLDEDLLALGSRFIAGIDTEPDRDRAVQTVLDELARQGSADADKPWLLIYDNVEQPQHIEHRLPRQGVRLLITSRWADWHPYAWELPIDTFPADTAIHFLLERARAEDNDSAALLAEELGYLPLALEHARTYCWNTSRSFEHYRTRVAELIAKAPAHSSYPATVHATFDLAIDQASENCPAVHGVMSALSFLEPEAIPLDILDELTDSENEMDAVLGALTTVSLLTFVPLEDGTTAVNQHRLVQAVARSRIEGNGNELVNRALSALIALWPGGNDGAHPENWPLCARLLPHATALLDHVDTQSSNDESIALLASWVGGYLGSRANFTAEEKWNRQSLEIRQRVLGEEHPDMAASYNNVAYNLNAQGRYDEAEPLFRQGLEIRQRVLGEEHPDTADGYNNVASNLNAQGRYDEAEPLHRKGLEIRQRVLGEEHPSTAASYNNVASNLNAQGRYDEAEPLYRKGLEIRQRVLGEEHPSTAASYNNVAYNLYDQACYEEAEPLYRKGLEIRQRVLGEEHPDTAASYNNVAANLYDQACYEEAEPLYRKGLEIRQRVLGEEHPDTADSYNNVAANLNAQGRYEEAEPLYCKGLEISQRVLGEEHPSTATSYNNVAYNLNAQGRYEEAEPLFRKGLEISQRALGEEHPSTAASYNNVASNLNAQGRYEEAEPLFRKAIGIAEKVLGQEHPTTQVLKNNLNALLKKN